MTMKLKILLAVTASAALMSGAALAQNNPSAAPENNANPAAGATGMSAPMDDTSMPPGAVNPGPGDSSGAATGSMSGAAPASTDAATPPATGDQTSVGAMAAPSATGAGADVSATVVQPRMVANAPIPDTKENRAKFGQPMSNAGKRSDAKGN